MAAILVLLGSVLGFFAALAAFFLFGVTPLAAILIWAASGPVVALALVRPARTAARRSVAAA